MFLKITNRSIIVNSLSKFRTMFRTQQIPNIMYMGKKTILKSYMIKNLIIFLRLMIFMHVSTTADERNVSKSNITKIKSNEMIYLKTVSEKIKQLPQTNFTDCATFLCTVCQH